ncbi:MAG: hypothetical protein KA010_03820 [Saprospiraceae bacterium]|nr:hypothetical protein [Saprospiraceae bacterium]
MDAIHLHLLINHLPIVGIIIGALIFYAGLIRSNRTVLSTGAWVMLISAILSFPTNMSGERAEDASRKLTYIEHDRVEHHEDMAKRFLFSNVGLAVSSLLYLFASKATSRLAGYKFLITIILIIFSISSMYFSIDAGKSGGEIRHEEIRQSS